MDAGGRGLAEDLALPKEKNAEIWDRILPKEDLDVAFDLVCEWASATYRRVAAKVKPQGGPWAALAQALGHVGALAGAEASERELRRSLADLYWQQSYAAVGDIIAAKTASGGDFASLVGAGGAERARELWPWYLYCLTFSADEQAGDSVVRFTLDSVDWRVLAWRYKTAITIVQLTEPDIRLGPPDGAAKYSTRLVQHFGRWAVLAGRKPPEGEASRLIGRLVRLSSGLCTEEHGEAVPLEARVFPLVGEVRSFDAEEDLFTVHLGVEQVVVEREDITRILHDPGFVGTLRDGGPLGSAVPKSFEHSVLHGFVREKARAKFAKLLHETGGIEWRAAGGRQQQPQQQPPPPPPPPPPQQEQEPIGATSEASAAVPNQGSVAGSMRSGPDQASRPPGEQPHQSAPSTSPAACRRAPKAVSASPEPEIKIAPGQEIVQGRVPLERLAASLERGGEAMELAVRAVCAFKAAEAGQLSVLPGDEVKVKRFCSDWVFVEKCSGSPGWGRRHEEGWCSRDHLTIWEAFQPFRPSPPWCADNEYLALDRGDVVVLKKRLEDAWRGWAFAERWGARYGGGLVPLSYLRPLLLASRRAEERRSGPPPEPRWWD